MCALPGSTVTSSTRRVPAITEDLITALSLIRDLKVIARNSTFAYKGQARDVKLVAAELDARYILEVSVRKSANRVRITAQLINAQNGHHMWAERFDRELDDIFELQDEITSNIASRAAPTLQRQEIERARKRPASDLDTWDMYTLSPWQPEKVLAIGSWIDSSLAMVRGGFLSAKERTALQAVMRHPSEIHGVARRANAILLLDDGWNCAKVAEALYLDDDTVRTWFKRYQAGGLDEMTVFDWKGRSGDLSRERMAELSARPGERLMRDSGEVAAYIAARWGVVYGPSGCVALLHRLGFEYKRPESLPARSDEARQAAFISRYDQLLNGLAVDEVVDFADAVHPEYQSRPTHGWVRTGDKVALRRTSGRQRLNLHAALNLENFHCPLVEAERIDAASTIALLAKLEASNPGKRRIYVIADNARYHHARVVRQWLERPDCRITLVFLPAYAPHLNAIERL